MTFRGFDKSRAVEIIDPDYGSGYRIGGRLVLTAAHLLQGYLGSKCRVRWRRAGKVEWEVDARVVWIASGADVALIELPNNIGDVEPVFLGQFPADAGEGRVSYEMYGWPEWAWTIISDEDATAEARSLPGEIFLADRSSQGLLVLESGRSGSQWGGCLVQQSYVMVLWWPFSIDIKGLIDRSRWKQNHCRSSSMMRTSGTFLLSTAFHLPSRKFTFQNLLESHLSNLHVSHRVFATSFISGHKPFHSQDVLWNSRSFAVS